MIWHLIKYTRKGAELVAIVADLEMALAWRGATKPGEYRRFMVVLDGR